MLVAVVGPTASAKSDVAMAVAVHFGVDIISVDSVQVYRGMDIGTAKPSLSEQAQVRHHLIDLCDPSVDFTVGEFQATGRVVLDQLISKASADGGRVGRVVTGVVVGGSGLHFRSLVDPLDFPPSDADVRAEIDATAPTDLVAEIERLDPDARLHVDLANPRRVARAVEIVRLTGMTPSARAAAEEARQVRDYVARYPFIGIGLDSGGALPARIERRLGSMVASGLVEEVAALAPRIGRNASQAVGYRQLLPVVAGDRELALGVADAVAATRALAKRQRTFFRRDPRIVWLPWSDDSVARSEAAVAAVEEQLCAL